jgi:hypothetical protein
MEMATSGRFADVAAATFEFSVHPDRCRDVALKALLMTMTEVERRWACLRQ